MARYFRENLSYHHCKSISDTAMYANPAGTEEIFIVNTFTDFDKEVFFAVRATDGANEAEESNIVSVFIASITTTTSEWETNNLPNKQMGLISAQGRIFIELTKGAFTYDIRFLGR